MKDVTVDSLELIAKIGFYIVMAGGALGFLGALIAGKFFAALMCLVGAFVVGVLMFGGLFLLLEMNENLRAVRKALEGKKE